MMELTVGVHHKAPFPNFSRRTFQSAWKRRQKRRGVAGSPLPAPDKAVVYFHGCAVNYYEPHVANAAIAILERNGYQVIVPEQVCLRASADQQRHLRRGPRQGPQEPQDPRRIRPQGIQDRRHVNFVHHTIKAEYREMLDIRDDDEKVVAEATWDICEFLLDLHEQGKLDTSFGRLDEDLPYHAPCQLRSHGIGLPAMDLFALVPGLRARDMDMTAAAWPAPMA